MHTLHLAGREPRYHVPKAIQLHILLGGTYSRLGWVLWGIAMVFFWAYLPVRILSEGDTVIEWFPVILTGTFVVLSLVLVLIGMKTGLRLLRLLANGQRAFARLASVTPLSPDIRGREILQITYEFTTLHGEKREVIVRSSALSALPSSDTMVLINGDEDKRLQLPFLAQAPELGQNPVCYDPQRPEHVVVLCMLPWKITLDPAGNIAGEGHGRRLLVCLYPLVPIFVHIFIAVMRFFI